MKKRDLPLDTNGRPFSLPSLRLEPKEYSKILSEINLVYEVQYKDKSISAHPSFGIDGRQYVYWFEIHGFNDYNIYLKTVDDH